MNEIEHQLREFWTEVGVSKERQNQILAEIHAKAQSGAMVGPFRIPGGRDTNQPPEPSPPQHAALVAFAALHGRRWKAELRRQWESASAEPELHRLRNTHGPTCLDRYRLPSD